MDILNYITNNETNIRDLLFPFSLLRKINLIIKV